MIWAFLFSILLNGGSADLGNYIAFSNISRSDAKEILKEVLDKNELKEAIQIIKVINKETRKAEKDINKLYIRLDRYSRKVKTQRKKVERTLIELEERRTAFHMTIYYQWSDFKGLFTQEEWENLVREVKEKASYPPAS